MNEIPIATANDIIVVFFMLYSTPVVYIQVQSNALYLIPSNF